MATQVATHQRNLESSILFMQQEHANTLKALHEEIHTLQKKCTDLTFQLTMNGIGDSDSDNKLKNNESELLLYKDYNAKQEKKLESKDAKIKALESDIHAQKKKYLGEIRSQTQTINTFKAELEAKSHNIAYLTTEYHKLKLKEKVDVDQADPSIRRTKALSYLPTPPKDIQAKLRGRPNRRAVNDELHHRPIRVSSGKSSGSSRSESPDITPFVQKEDSRPIVDKRKHTSVLPPISRSMSQDKGAVLVRHVPGQHLGRHNQESVSPEIATLAVDQVSRAEPGLVHARESRSSEYK